MRFLIVASLFAYAAASHPAIPYALAPAVPTISAGDINGAYIDAHVEANDHARAAYDASRQAHDKVNELHGQAVNAAEEHAWRTVDAVKTVEARLDGAAAAAAPVLAKQIARSSPIVPVSHAPVVAQTPVVAETRVVAQAVVAPAPIVETRTVVAPAPVVQALQAPVFSEPQFYQPFYDSIYQPIEFGHEW